MLLLCEILQIHSLLVLTEEEINFECISTAIVLDDNKDSTIDKLVRKLPRGANVQHDSVKLGERNSCSNKAASCKRADHQPRYNAAVAGHRETVP